MMSNTSIQLPKILKLLAQTLPKLQSENKLNKDSEHSQVLLLKSNQNVSLAFLSPPEYWLKLHDIIQFGSGSKGLQLKGLILPLNISLNCP